MQIRFRVSRFAVMPLLAVMGPILTPIVFAQNSQQPQAARIDTAKLIGSLTGVWGAPKEEQKGKFVAQKDEPIPLSKWGQGQYNYNHDFTQVPGAFDYDRRGRNELDPSSHCFPPGPTRTINSVGSGEMGTGPLYIVPFQKEILFIYESGQQVRHIWTDGRQHPTPDQLDLSWGGHSVGQWDGDTFVVDTIGIRDETWLDSSGHAHSDQLHVVERYRRLNQDVLQLDVTIEDPKALTKPWTQHKAYWWRPDLEMIEDVVCTGKYRKGVYLGEGPAGL